MPARLGAVGALVAVGVVLAVIISSTTGSSGNHAPKTASNPSSSSSSKNGSASTAAKPGTAAVPILAYHVINVAPPLSSAPPALYVPADEFSSQMNALKTAGWHAVTLDQLEAYWTHGTSLGSGKPIVITFDDGYASQYTNALPVLKSLGWDAVVNLVVNGLSPGDGGLTDTQVKGLIAAGWQIGTEGESTADLTAGDPTQVQSELTTARDTLKTRYNVELNWFSYPVGAYNPAVTAAVKAAGFVGATTTVSGWANPQEDRFRLPRLEVTGGTSPSQLLSEITAAQQDPAPADSDRGTGTT